MFLIFLPLLCSPYSIAWLITTQTQSMYTADTLLLTFPSSWQDLSSWTHQRVKHYNIYLIWSCDGAQLYQNVESDCWIFIGLLLTSHWACTITKDMSFMVQVFLGQILWNFLSPLYIQAFIILQRYRMKAYKYGMGYINDYLHPHHS